MNPIIMDKIPSFYTTKMLHFILTFYHDNFVSKTSARNQFIISTPAVRGAQPCLLHPRHREAEVDILDHATSHENELHGHCFLFQ
jgi:hypothetical protein